MQRITATLIALVGVVAVPAAAIAQLDAFTDAPFEISADSIDYERARDVPGAGFSTGSLVISRS